VPPGQRGRPLGESGLQRVSVVNLKQATSLYGYKLNLNSLHGYSPILKPIWLQYHS
jgi:hypothetical protein